MIDNANNTISISASGNCNFSYITGLSYGYEPTEAGMRKVLFHTLTTPEYRYDRYGQASVKTKPTYRAPSGGIYLFAQGSEDPVSTKPYAHNFKKVIEVEKLGQVIECPPAPNPRHGGKPGILFIWIIDHKACAAWWAKQLKKKAKTPSME